MQINIFQFPEEPEPRPQPPAQTDANEGVQGCLFFLAALGFVVLFGTCSGLIDMIHRSAK